MSVATTNDFRASIYARLMDYAGGPGWAGGTLRTRLTGGLWYRRAPSTAAPPYAVYDVDWPDTQSARAQVFVGVTFWRSPASSAAEMRALEDDADLCEQAFTDYHDVAAGTAGAAWSTNRGSRTPVPPFEDAADAELAGLRVARTIVAYPGTLLALGFPGTA